MLFLYRQQSFLNNIMTATFTSKEKVCWPLLNIILHACMHVHGIRGSRPNLHE